MWISWMLFSLRGRIRRRDWWVFGFLLGMVQLIGTAIIYGATFPLTGPETLLWGSEPPAAVLLALLFLWPTLALAVKRAHDRDGSGWSAVLVTVAVAGLGWLGRAIPPIWDDDPGSLVRLKVIADLVLPLLVVPGLLYLLVTLGVRDGTPGPNRFGPSPKRFDLPSD